MMSASTSAIRSFSTDILPRRAVKGRKSGGLRSWLFVLVCVVILASLAGGWLLTGQLMRMHDAMALTWSYALRGFGPTYEQIQCVKAWDSSADRRSCGQKT